MKFLITGAADFIEFLVIRYIVNNTNYTVVNVDKLIYIRNLESLVSIVKRQGYKVICIEEIEFNHGWPTLDEVVCASDKSSYGQFFWLNQ